MAKAGTIDGRSNRAGRERVRVRTYNIERHTRRSGASVVRSVDRLAARRAAASAHLESRSAALNACPESELSNLTREKNSNRVRSLNFRPGCLLRAALVVRFFPL